MRTNGQTKGCTEWDGAEGENMKNKNGGKWEKKGHIGKQNWNKGREKGEQMRPKGEKKVIKKVGTKGNKS